jgi:beta-aspartyl-peptidase (threonine type)
MDALIMDGTNLDLGAIAAVQRIRNPITLARRVMTDSVHNFLVADGAEAFADAIGFPRYDTADLIYQPDMEEYLSSLDNPSTSLSGSILDSGPLGDKVGAVALDVAGNLAAATSTGGTRRKQPGRVGDSPLPGSGAYADNWTAAVSATGRGESLMKVLISKRVCDFVASGLSAQKACDAAIALLEERVNGFGGMIAIDARGHVGLSFNTEAMPYAYAIDDQAILKGK